MGKSKEKRNNWKDGSMFGEVFGWLMVLGVHTGDKMIPVGCLRCGTETLVYSGNLTSSKVQSCGCLRRDWINGSGGQEARRKSAYERRGTEPRENERSASWARDVKARDGCCTVCGSTKRLHAHHIFNVAHHSELVNELSNGVTLCRKCHKKFHSEFGYKCTADDFEEFMAAHEMGFEIRLDKI